MSTTDPSPVARNESLEDVLSRQRREAKELTGRITALKKTVGGNKQKKKEIQAQIAQLEKDLSERHERERADAKSKVTGPDEDQTQNNVGVVEAINSPDGSSMASESSSAVQDKARKPNKAKLRKQRKAAEFEEMRRQAADEAADMVNHKEIEDEAIASLILPLGLSVKQITPDGHCMYNAIADQISFRGKGEPMSYKDLRSIAANYLREHPEDFVPFLVNQDGNPYTPEEYDKYCDEVENTAVWGGQLELQALSRGLRRHLQIIQMGSPLIKIGEDFPGEPLMLSYHRHAYGLGEHYNSLRPVVE
ncbi:uncharacterized protein SPPG_08312 [Spizellomyces punctatus DAOM BR117]|uniref:OTU domain-containing protein n=1 Tax=Spizellomyces punctatus (strain DAOM BR117) TaxID=645134 RepID=A0A0L0H615_SPIPD|nr:uncharacterized protein SPPG_08312 [Spizellomyces punctatus DAOM BR117]KNC96414.1 hypothetical protein SPPG_08312 [Spizellomyces punctatus DAOM BR117]|eukprot:XP_016604454.1 hypothetical protein SPPG_08312 [Spizellomyces punctatus DAOM BR117]